MVTPLYSASYRQLSGRIRELKRLKRYAEALEEIELLRAEGSRTPGLAVDRADVLARLGRKSEALEQLEEAAADFELSAYGQTLRAALLEEAGRTPEAEALFLELAQAPRLDRFSARRVCRFLVGREEPERAVALLERLGLGTELAEVLSRALEAAGHQEQAVEVLRQASEEREELFDRYALKALKGAAPDVRREELEGLISMPAHRDNLNLRANLARACRQDGDAARARELLLAVVERAPDNGFFLHQLALAHRDLGEHERAVELLEDLLRADPFNKFCRASYFATCRQADAGERARATVAELTSKDRSLGFLWGAYRKAFS